MAAVPVGALFATILLMGALGVWSTAPGSPLRGVPAEDFAQLSIKPAEAGTVAAIDEAAAIGIANGREEPGEVRQALLARDVFSGGQLVWVLSFDPKTVIPVPPLGGCYSTNPKDIKVIFSLMVINADTGEFVRGMEHSEALVESDCEESRSGQGRPAELTHRLSAPA
jgi:hypothetical protein